MKILLANDDGVFAEGLRILADAIRTIAEVDVIAPDRDRSGASNSLTLRRPLHVKRLENGFYMVDGTPTDCVHLAVTGLLRDNPPDMVIAGINAGANLGDDVIYSGTVAAAMEGRFLGLPAIAISLVLEEQGHYHTAAEVTKRLVQRLQQDPLPPHTILNVNVPDVPVAQLTGMAISRLGVRHQAAPVIKTNDPRGNEIYWLNESGIAADASMGTDFYAIAKRQISITPLHVDLTHYQSFEQIAGWMNGMQLEKILA